MPLPPRILLIDSRRGAADQLDIALGNQGVFAEIVHVASAQDACDALAENNGSPDAIVIDVTVQADHDTVRILKPMARSAKAHLIAHARTDDPPTRRFARAAGADHVVGALSGHEAVARLLRRLLSPGVADAAANENDLLQWLVIAGEGRLGPERAVGLLIGRGIDEARARQLLKRWLEQGRLHSGEPTPNGGFGLVPDEDLRA